MAKQTKSTQESAKPKKPLVNWFSRTKEKSSVKDSIAPDSSVINYYKKKVTAPASVLGGGKMTKNYKDVDIKKGSGGSKTFGHVTEYKKSKEGQKSKSLSFTDVSKHNEDSSSHIDYKLSRRKQTKFRKPTKLLGGVDISRDGHYIEQINQKDTTRGKMQPVGRTEGLYKATEKKLRLPKNTEKNMRDSFGNQKPSPDFIVKKTKTENEKTKDSIFYNDIPNSMNMR
jgi:hypothetical protein